MHARAQDPFSLSLSQLLTGPYYFAVFDQGHIMLLFFDQPKGLGTTDMQFDNNDKTSPIYSSLH